MEKSMSNRDIVSKYWFDDRHAQILYDKDMGMFLVEMYEKVNLGMKKIATVPMITGQVIHSERYAEDAAENWVHGWPVELLPKNDNEKQ